MHNSREVQPIRVLLADDHAVVRAGIRLFLDTASDIRVVFEAETGRAVCEFVQRETVDVAVVDIQMPQMTGIEVTRWLTENFPSIRVLVLTSFDDAPYISAVVGAGASGYVLKTAKPAEIVAAVRRVYRGRNVIDPALTESVFKVARGAVIAEPENLLSSRELEVLDLAAKGKTNKAIGVALGISDRTVQGHLARIFPKLGVASRTEAVARGYQLGLIDLNEAA